MTQNMKVTKAKKTSLVRRDLQPSFNLSFELKLEEGLISNTFLTLQLKQAMVFTVKGKPGETVFKIYFLFYSLSMQYGFLIYFRPDPW